jgi:hypothetical protein
MIIKNLDLVVNGIILAASLLAIIFTSGVVWRVEKKLDISYKLLLSILAFTAAEIISFSNPLNDFWIDFAESTMKMLFAVFFLWGVWTMRNMIRSIDGEKPKFTER